MKRNWKVRVAMAAVILAGVTFVGQTAPGGEEWLPISQEDLALKDNPASPGAHAMILYREDRINANAGTDDQYFRIKIFTAEGVKEASNIELVSTTQFRIGDIRGRTIQADGRITNLDGKVFEKTGTFANGSKSVVKAFAMPEVQPGCIIEYRYRRQFDSKFYWSHEWTIQGSWFLRTGRFSILPSNSARAPQLMFRQYGLPSNARPERQPDGSLALEVHDLPGVEKEELMPPDQVLRARVSFFYRDMSAGYNETTDSYWKRIGKARSDALDAFVNKRGVLEAEVRRVTSAEDSPDVKLQKLCARVRELRDLDYERAKNKEEKKEENIKPNANVEDVLKHGYASGRELNFLFVGLARAAGYSATEVYLAPRSESEFAPQIQDEKQLTADVVWVRAGDKEIFLDPASRFQPYGTLPWSETASKGIKVGKDGVEFVTTSIPTSAEAVIARHTEVQLGEDGAATGKMEVDFTGYRAAAWRQGERFEDPAGRKKKLEDGLLTWLPTGSTVEVTKITDWDEVTKPLHVEATFKIPELGSAVGHRMLAPASIFHYGYMKAFIPAKRVNLVYFRFPFEEKDELQYTAPKGFTVETTPVGKKFDTGAVYYEIESTQQGATANVKRRLAVNTIVVPVENYPTLRAVFSGVKTNDEAQIVLQNSESASKN